MKMRRFLIAMLAMCVLFSNVAFATEALENSNGIVLGYFDVDENGNIQSVRSVGSMRAVPNAGSGSEITPFATTFGDVGAAIIEWTNSSQVWWELSPYDSGALIGFTGRVTIEKFAASGKYTRVWTDPVDSGGIGAISGTVSVPYLHEGSYRATLGGSGTVGLTFYIVQGCNASRYIIR